MFRLVAIVSVAFGLSLSFVCHDAEARQTSTTTGPQAAKQLRERLEAIQAAQRAPQLRGFSLTLVQGDMKGPSTSEGVPPPVAKALADLKDFLPYKGYTLLDTQWTLGSGIIRNRLKRSESQSYELEMTANYQFLSGGQPRVMVSNFHLRDSPGATAASSPQRIDDAKVQELQKSLESVRSRMATLKDIGRLGGEEELAMEIQARQLEASILNVQGHGGSLAIGDSLIDTSFQMAVGETVVVGTSRLQGDRALIVLVTAVGR